ncbi:endothelial cell-selective adhesion molecule [Lacerta agilis]|uniref:endothelial cell-selective adhesion molecule n=1 Tax=Lacerta agilis TaxID=80427 RepID=UPI00141A3191|nr:endothelial cell-selective adhesion molecule [Lacerta agilis]
MEPLPLALGLAALLAGLSCSALQVQVGTKSVVVIQGQRAILPVWYTPESTEQPFVTWHLERPHKHSQVAMEAAAARRWSAHARHFAQTHSIATSQCNITTPCPQGVPPFAAPGSEEASSAPAHSVCMGACMGSRVCTVRSDAVRVSPGGSPCPSVFRPGLVSVVIFADRKRGILRLNNLTAGMSGTYFCNASSDAGSSSCTIALEVYPPINGAMVAGAVIGALIGLGLIILFPLQMLFYRRKKKEAQEEMANEIKEDAVAPKTLSWAKSPGSDIVSKNGTLSSMNTTRDHKLYPSKPPSDTASITTATGSTVGYKPPFSNHRSGTHTPTPSLSSQSLPLYFPPMANGVHCHHANVPIHRNTLHRTNGAQPQAPRLHEPAAPTQGLTSSTLSRMGAVPVMVPAQSQAGSLV